MSALTPGYTGRARYWRGVIKLDGVVVADCGHDHTSRRDGRGSAVGCAQSLLLAAVRSDLDGGQYCHRKSLHAWVDGTRETMLRRGLGKAAADEAVVAAHAHIDEVVTTLRAAIEAGTTAPSRY